VQSLDRFRRLVKRNLTYAENLPHRTEPTVLAQQPNRLGSELACLGHIRKFLPIEGEYIPF